MTTPSDDVFEFSIRKHVTYGVHRYRVPADAPALADGTPDPRAGKSDILSQGLSLERAGELLNICAAAHPEAKITAYVD